MAQTLATVAADYDYVVLDCPPTLQTFTVMALVAADAYLIATEPELFALSGLSTLTELADGVVEGLNSKLRFAGVTVKITAFSSVITESNALRLEQYLYWAPGKRKKQDAVNAALKMFFDSKPESDRAIPDEG